MPADPVRRQAARTATIIAVPVALAVAGISIWTYGASGAKPSATVTVQSTAAVQMSAPALTEDVAGACRAVVAHLPDTILDHKRRPVTAGSEQNAAYGDPAITFSCGVVAPSLAPTTMVYNAGAVCWAATTVASGTEWTTVDRTITQQVFVPGDSDGSGQAVVPFADAVADAVPRLATAPTGCG